MKTNINSNLEYLNYLLDLLSNEFINKNINYLNNINRQLCTYYDNNILLKDKMMTKISKNEVIEYVKDFLKYIDNSHELFDVFNDSLNNNRIILWDETEKKNIRDIFKNKYGMDFFDIDIPMYQCLRDSESDEITDGIISLKLSYTIKDCVYLVHEFFHYLSLEHRNKDKTFVIDNKHFIEVPSIYFETRMCDFLVKKGFNTFESYSIIRNRYHDSLIESNISGLTIFLKLVERQIKDDYITYDNVLKDEDINYINYIKNIIYIDSVEGLLNIEKIFLKNIITSIDNNDIESYVDFLVKKLKNNYNYLSRFSDNSFSSTISYNLGTYFASKRRDKKMDKVMFFVLDNLTNAKYDDNDFLNIISNKIKDTNYKNKSRGKILKK